jgi:hypothetical protein
VLQWLANFAHLVLPLGTQALCYSAC